MPPAPPEGAVIVDNSILSAVAHCDTLAFTEYACHLRRKGTALPLEAGSACHAGLAEWLRRGTTAAAVPRAMAAVRAYYQPAVAAWETRAEKEIPEGDRFRPEWVYGVMERYLRENSGKFPFKLVGDVVEQPTAAHLFDLKDGRPVWIVARLDARVRKFASGGKWNLDWKTTKRVTDWWKDKTKSRSQFLGQLWIAEQQGEPLEGVVLGVVEIPEKHRAEFCKTHKRPWKECDLEHAGWDWVYITPNRGELPVWHATAVALTKRHLRLVARAEAEGIEGVREVLMTGRFNDSCTFCDHKDWCRDGRPSRPANVRALFERRVWDPLHTSD